MPALKCEKDFPVVGVNCSLESSFAVYAMFKGKVPVIRQNRLFYLRVERDLVFKHVYLHSKHHLAQDMHVHANRPRLQDARIEWIRFISFVCFCKHAVLRQDTLRHAIDIVERLLSPPRIDFSQGSPSCDKRPNSSVMIESRMIPRI